MRIPVACTLLLLSIFIARCTNSAAEKKTVTAKKKIILADSLPMYDPAEKFTGTVKDYIKPGQKKIAVYLSASCFSCTEDLILWNDIMKTTTDENIVFLFYLNIYDINIIKPYLRKWRFRHPIIEDKTDAFYKQNGLTPEKKFHAMILDEQNQLIYWGNPIYDTAAKRYFESFLKKMD